MMAKTKAKVLRFPLWLTAALAVLTLPRAVVHDLRLLPFDSFLYLALAIIPWIIWLLVAVFWKTKKPLLDFIIVGAAYGLLLALAHQILWSVSWSDNLPHLQGNLEGKLDPAVESLLLRTAAFISSVITGLVTGLIFGLVALSLSKIRKTLNS